VQSAGPRPEGPPGRRACDSGQERPRPTGTDQPPRGWPRGKRQAEPAHAPRGGARRGREGPPQPARRRAEWAQGRRRARQRPPPTRGAHPRRRAPAWRPLPGPQHAGAMAPRSPPRWRGARAGRERRAATPEARRANAGVPPHRAPQRAPAGKRPTGWRRHRRNTPPRRQPGLGAQERREQEHRGRQRGDGRRTARATRRRRGRARPRGTAQEGARRLARQEAPTIVPPAASPRWRRGRRPRRRGPGGRQRPTETRDAQSRKSPTRTRTPQGARPVPARPPWRGSGSAWRGRRGPRRLATRQHRGVGRRHRDRPRSAARPRREGGAPPGFATEWAGTAPPEGRRQRRPAAQRGGPREEPGTMTCWPRQPSGQPKPSSPAGAASRNGERGQDRGDREQGTTEAPRRPQAGKPARHRRRSVQPRRGRGEDGGRRRRRAGGGRSWPGGAGRTRNSGRRRQPEAVHADRGTAVRG